LEAGNGGTVPAVQSTDKVVAIYLSDIHLSLKPPAARRGEDDWFNAMAYTLGQVTAAASRYDVPVLCTGDIFDHWRAEPALVNFALGFLPDMYAIPGQHDMPLHSLELIKKSAFWTLVMAGKVTPVMPAPAQPVVIQKQGLVVYGFPWGSPITPPLEYEKNWSPIALVHQYIWQQGACYPGAPEENKVSKVRGLLSGYLSAAFGDNHQGFVFDLGEGRKGMNCGTLMRRKADEAGYTPHIGLLCRSGNVLVHHLRTSTEVLDKTVKDVRSPEEVTDLRVFFDEIGNMQRNTIDFLEALKWAMESRNVEVDVRKEILKATGLG